MKSLSAQIVDYIMDHIQRGEWQLDSMIPTERELCEQFAVSRPTVRAAMQQLVNKGYLVRTKGKGTFVTKPKTIEKSSIFIESFAEEMKQQGLITKTEVLEFRCMSCDESIARQLQVKEDDKVIKLARLRYVDGSFDKGPIVLTTSYFVESLEYILEYDLERLSLSSVLKGNKVFRHFLEKSIDVAMLGVKESRLLGVAEGSPALYITSHARDQNRNLIEYCESYYPAGRHRFTLRIHT